LAFVVDKIVAAYDYSHGTEVAIAAIIVAIVTKTTLWIFFGMYFHN